MAISVGPSAGSDVRVPLLRLDAADPELLEELLETVREIATAGAFTLGEEVERFEREFAQYCGSEHAVGVSSGTEALALALRALEIGRGDKVIVPANSFIATAEAVTLVGAEPVLVDVDEETMLIRAQEVEAALDPAVRAVIPVHLCGRTVELAPIMALARRAGIHVIEDTAQAHGAHAGGRRAGATGTIGCFSFYPTKNLGAWGDGGAVVTDDPELADRVRLLRSHGERPRYNHRIPGTTARLDTLQAAVLRRKLERIEDWTDVRRRIGARLTVELRGSCVEPPAPVRDGGDHVFHLFVVRTTEREALRAHLDAAGIATAVHYPTPIHRTEAYAHLGLGPGSLPVAERLSEEILTLPLHPHMTTDEVDRVVSAVHSFRPQGPAPGDR